MNWRTNTTWVLTLASLKMWYRDRQAIFWTFFLPVVLMVIFGVLNFGDFGAVELGVVDQAGTPASRSLVSSLEHTEAFHLFNQPAGNQPQISLGAMTPRLAFLRENSRRWRTATGISYW